MGSRSHAEAVLARAREALAKGPMSEGERTEFDCARAWEMFVFEQSRHPERFADQLPLALPARKGDA